MTDALTMKAAVAQVIADRLGRLVPLPPPASSEKLQPGATGYREMILRTEQELRRLITGNEEEVHEWLAVIHYALADERSRLLHY